LNQWVPEEGEKRNWTFRELVEKYSEWCVGRQRWKGYAIKQLLKKFSDIPLEDFTTHALELFQAELLQAGKKPSTVNRRFAVLAHMFQKAYDWGMCSEETLKKVRRVKMLRENNRRLRYLSKEECLSLINACDPHLKPIVIVALNTGMRKQEILRLKWSNVDLKHGLIILDQDQTKNRERKEIPLNETLKRLFASLPRRLDIPYVFYDPASGKPYRDVRKSFASALRRAGIRDFHFHDLRHTFASQLVMAGVDLTTVKELMGHKTITMTLRYAHLAPAHKAEAVKKIDIFQTSKLPVFEAKND